MKVLITGSSGFIGVKLVNHLIEQPRLNVLGVNKNISSLCTLDIVKSNIKSTHGVSVIALQGSLNDPHILEKIIDYKPDIVFHLASIVSSMAESEFSMGMHVNIQGTIKLLDALRYNKHKALFVMTSSLAVFGGTLPECISDDHPVCPQSSYGTQKAICELLVNDYSRKNFIDGRVLRLPTVVVRPGKANAAASSFMSSIIREPINGLPSECYAPKDFKIWITSPKSVISYLINSIIFDQSKLKFFRVLNMPGISVSIGEMINSLKRITGNSKIEELIKFREDKKIYDIVATWPINFHVSNAVELGFKGNASIDEIIEEYINYDK